MNKPAGGDQQVAAVTRARAVGGRVVRFLAYAETHALEWFVGVLTITLGIWTLVAGVRPGSDLGMVFSKTGSTWMWAYAFIVIGSIHLYASLCGHPRLRKHAYFMTSLLWMFTVASFVLAGPTSVCLPIATLTTATSLWVFWRA